MVEDFYKIWIYVIDNNFVLHFCYKISILFCVSKIILFIVLSIMKSLIEKITAEFESFSKEAHAQLEKGNKAAGTRARKAALELSKLMKEFRKVSVEESKK